MSQADTGSEHNLAEVLAVIAQPLRLRLLVLLWGGERCVCDLHREAGIAQNLASHHLKALTDAGLLTRRRDGIKILYRRNEKALARCVASLARVLAENTHARTMQRVHPVRTRRTFVVSDALSH